MDARDSGEGTPHRLSAMCRRERTFLSCESSTIPQSRWHPGRLRHMYPCVGGEEPWKWETSSVPALAPLSQAFLICRAKRMGHGQETLESSGPQKHACRSTSTRLPSAWLPPAARVVMQGPKLGWARTCFQALSATNVLKRFILFYFIFIPLLRTCLLILERGEGRERKGAPHQCERETSIGCLSYPPCPWTRRILQLGHVP